MNIDKKLNVILTANEKKADGILAVIALKGPKCYDDLYRSRPKSLGSGRIVKERENLGSQSAVHKALMHLKKCKLLRVYKKVPHKPKDKVLYDLTLSGLIVALLFEVLWKRKNLNNVIINHGKKLPLILGKWDFFKETKTVSNVKRRVKEYFSRPPEIVHVSPYHLLIYGLEKKGIEKKESFMRKLINEKFEQCLREDINRAILFPWVFGIVYDFYVPDVNIPGTKETKGKLKVTDDMETWISILLLDDELKSYLISELNHLEKYGNFCSKVAKLYKHVIEKYPLYWYSKKSN